MKRLVANEGDIGHVFIDCLDPDKLWELYGVQGALLAPVAFAGGFLSFMRTQVEGVIDSATQNHRYTVVVKWEDSKILRYRNMTLRLPSSWNYRHVAKYDPQLVAISPGNGCEVGGYWETGCPYILLVGPKAIDDMCGGDSPYSQSDGGYFPTCGLQYCPGQAAEKVWMHSPRFIHRPGSSQAIGNRTARSWSIPVHCSTTMPGPGVPLPPVKYVQTEFFLPQSKILIVIRDRSAISGLEAVLQSAQFD